MVPQGFTQTDSNSDLQSVRKLANAMDSQFRLPMGIRIGWDGLLGFIPFGDIVTNSFSFFIVYKAAVMGCPPAVIMRMGLNLLIDNLLDAIPLIGNIFDFIWKANNKNIELLERYAVNPGRTATASKVTVFVALAVVLVLIVGSIAAVLAATVWLFEQIKVWNTAGMPV